MSDRSVDPRSNELRQTSPRRTRQAERSPANTVRGKPADGPACPVSPAFEQALSSAQEFTRAIRRLRRAMNSCEACKNVDECPIRAQIGQAIDAAIVEVTDEWGLVER